MELRQLRSFASVARELSFTRAARALRIAQPALSRQIQGLEHELGFPLFVRAHGRIGLTQRGQTFLREAEALLEQSQLALERARSGFSQTLNLGYVWGLFHSLVPAALHRFRERSPETAIHLFDLSAMQQSQALLEGRLDAGFIGFALEADHAGLRKEKIGSCEFLIALPSAHALARKRAVPLRQLQHEVFLAISDDHFPGASRLMLHACAQAGFQPRILQTAERGHTLLGLVAARCGVALLPAPLQALPHDGVVLRKPIPAFRSDLYLAWREGLDPEVLEGLLAAARAQP